VAPFQRPVGAIEQWNDQRVLRPCTGGGGGAGGSSCVATGKPESFQKPL